MGVTRLVLVRGAQGSGKRRGDDDEVATTMTGRYTAAASVPLLLVPVPALLPGRSAF